ncbi:MAG TPA: hypothetical protein VKH64_16720 [Candidatus Binatia bacterium]|nr:hypothetical protein [Candidatus Binatia bacterium]
MNRKPRDKRSEELDKLAKAAGRAIRRAAKAARKTARMHGTPIYIEENGKIIALKP